MKKTILSLLLLTNITFSKHIVVEISVPKCGTNLLSTLLTRLLECKKTPNNSTISSNYINKAKHHLHKHNTFLLTHDGYTKQKDLLLVSHDARAIMIMRDPRDQLVSAAYYMKKNPQIKKFAKYHDMSIEDIIHDLIEGNTPNPSITNIKMYYDRFLPWLDHSNVYITTFEKLVGPQGGGTIQEQLTEIMNIANHIGISISEEKAKKIANHIFGKGGTFRKGQIGDWKNHFTQEHKERFKKIAGQLLIDLGYEKDFNW